VPIADVTRQVVLVDDLAHVAQDLGRGRDRGAGPRLEAVAESVEIAVGADARIAMGEPGAAKAFLRFEDDKAHAGALPGEVIGGADPGNPGPDDHNVELFSL
jgi:hypothetical protein